MEARRGELVQRAGTGKEPASGESPKSSGDTGFWNGGTLTEGEKLAGYTADWSKWRGECLLEGGHTLSPGRSTLRALHRIPPRGTSAPVVEIAAVGRSSANIVWSSLEISGIPIQGNTLISNQKEGSSRLPDQHLHTNLLFRFQ